MSWYQSWFGPKVEGDAKPVYDDLTNTVNKLNADRMATKAYCKKLEGWISNYERNFFRFKLNWDLRMNYKIYKDRLYELEDKFDELNTNYRHARLLKEDLEYQAGRPEFNIKTWLANNKGTLNHVTRVAKQMIPEDFDKWVRDRIAATVEKTIPDSEHGGDHGRPVYPVNPDVQPEDTDGNYPVKFDSFFGWENAASIASHAAASAMTTILTLNFLRRMVSAHGAGPYNSWPQADKVPRTSSFGCNDQRSSYRRSISGPQQFNQQSYNPYALHHQEQNPHGRPLH